MIRILYAWLKEWLVHLEWKILVTLCHSNSQIYLTTSRSMRHACAEISSGNAGAYKQQLKTVTCHALDEEVTFFSHDGRGNSRGQEWARYLVRSSTLSPRRTRWHTNLMLHRRSGRLSTSPCGFTQAPCSGAKPSISNSRNVK